MGLNAVTGGTREPNSHPFRQNYSQINRFRQLNNSGGLSTVTNGHTQLFRLRIVSNASFSNRTFRNRINRPTYRLHGLKSVDVHTNMRSNGNRLGIPFISEAVELNGHNLILLGVESSFGSEESEVSPG
ncbi:hypothetical protein V8G54_002675 [Vigna mungo]|uniref:Uncharacterized protein n=1 Tax=Vigna mungo TaxID=3915 RepID=A0AAQ3P8Q1_VIGMU